MSNETTNYEEKRKRSLFRYIAVMFIVAFLLVLVSLLGQSRHEAANSGAAEKAEQLQEENRQLQQQIEELNLQLREQQTAAETAQQQVDDLQQQLQGAQTEAMQAEEILAAYEDLLTGNTETIHTEHLGPKGLETYENLTKEGNEQ